MSTIVSSVFVWFVRVRLIEERVLLDVFCNGEAFDIEGESIKACLCDPAVWLLICFAPIGFKTLFHPTDVNNSLTADKLLPIIFCISSIILSSVSQLQLACIGSFIRWKFAAP